MQIRQHAVLAGPPEAGCLAIVAAECVGNRNFKLLPKLLYPGHNLIGGGRKPLPILTAASRKGEYQCQQTNCLTDWNGRRNTSPKLPTLALIMSPLKDM